MKKLFMFLAVASMATFGASCSSDDSSSKKTDDNPDDVGPPPAAKQLVLSADATSILEGGTVKFTVKAEGKEEGGAELYIGSEKISNPHTFAEAGEYKVVAKKKDFKDSTAVTIKVTKEGEPGDDLKLTLTPSKTEAFVGDAITFTVKDENGANVTGFKVKHANGTDVTNSIFMATEVGTFKFIASKDGYVTSDEVSVNVEAKVVPEGDYVQVEGKVAQISMKQLVVNGRKINNQWVPYVYEQQGLRFVVFSYDMGSVNQAQTAWEMRSSTVILGIQPAGEITKENMVWPANPGEGSFISEAFAVDFTSGANPVVVEFNMQTDLLDLDFPASDTEKLLLVKIMNEDDSAINFDGSFGDVFYWNEVDASGNPVPRAISKVKDNRLKTNAARK